MSNSIIKRARWPIPCSRQVLQLFKMTDALTILRLPALGLAVYRYAVGFL
jgi:hypothetical protein